MVAREGPAKLDKSAVISLNSSLVERLEGCPEPGVGTRCHDRPASCFMSPQRADSTNQKKSNPKSPESHVLEGGVGFGNDDGKPSSFGTALGAIAKVSKVETDRVQYIGSGFIGSKEELIANRA